MEKITVPLCLFSAETVYVERTGTIIQREPVKAYYYDEPLDNQSNSTIEPIRMVAIPAGEFWMGSPQTEKDRFNWESPQHLVRVCGFYMSQTPITQEQWRAVAALPQQQRQLNPTPSHFQGDNLPVEGIGWHDAIKFCARLSRQTGKNYRLPSEAEWEYACRAKGNDSSPTPKSRESSTPFHFGETITANLANYDASVVYQQEAPHEYRGRTTPVRTFPPNAFGLYDLHGQVWEWCLDPSHGNYEGAPDNSSVWDEKNNDNRYQNLLSYLDRLMEDKRAHIFRGGSWDVAPKSCRCASRYFCDFDKDVDNGFRVVCQP